MATTLRARVVASRKMRTLRLLAIAIGVVAVAAYSRVAAWEAASAAADRGMLKGSPGDAMQLPPGRHLLSAAGCDDSTCVELKADGETSFLWNALLYWPVMLYAFYGLAIVCDDFFVASLERISEVLKLSEDVAGATFMAAGSSAPELFTSTVDVFIFENNVGVGTIVGSAVFNILVIIALSATASAQALLIDWKPLTRDCLFYSVSIALLVVFTETESSVAWWEAACLVLWYCVYIAFMTRNKEIFDRVDAWIEQGQERWQGYKERRRLKKLEAQGVDVAQLAAQAVINMQADPLWNTDDQPAEAKPEQASEYMQLQHKAALRRRFRVAAHVIIAANYLQRRLRHLHARRELWQKRCSEIPKGTAPTALRKFRAAVHVVMLCRFTLPSFVSSARRQALRIEDFEVTLEESKAALAHTMAVAEEDTAAKLAPYVEPPPVVVPLTRSQLALAVAVSVVAKPWNLMLGYTIPNCEEPRWRRWYLVTFLMSILWIGVLSWVLVEMASRIGCSLGISTVVMGLTALAAGTSIPDALGSIVVARDGMGNMAVSNAIGSNVFDICLGIGLPYFVKTAIVDSGSTIAIADTRDIEVSIAILGGTVVFVWVALAASMWRLTQRVGYALLLCYGAFIAYTLLKPDECD